MLKLFWTDSKNNIYHLGNLYKIKNKYHFDIIQDGLRNAIRHGCFGIGSIDITKDKQESDKLFSFFMNRIPKENELKQEELVEMYGIERYDEMELLRITGGRTFKDRYYLEEE